MTREASEYHEARLLVLLAPHDRGVSGLTKLAKLDFLLRYPVMLERLASSEDLSLPGEIGPTPSERTAVESPMIRYKYGPWDNRYYAILGALVSKGLLQTSSSASSMRFELTDRGRDLATEIGGFDEWARTAGRAAYLRAHFNRSGNALKTQIYKQLPDVVARPHRQEIR